MADASLTASVDPFLGIIELISDFTVPVSVLAGAGIQMRTAAGSAVVDSEAVFRPMNDAVTRIYLSAAQWRLLIRATELQWQPVILMLSNDDISSPVKLQASTIKADVQGLNSNCHSIPPFLLSY